MKRARPWRKISNDVASKMMAAVQELPDNELRVLSTVDQRVKSTNCWWLTHAAAPAMASAAQIVLSSRRHVRGSERRAK